MDSKKMWDNVKEGAKTAADYTVEMSKIAGTRIVELEKITPLLAKRFNLTRNIHKQYEQLGEVAYELLKIKNPHSNVDGNPDIQEMTNEIKALEKDILQVEKQIETLKADYDKKVSNLKNDSKSGKQGSSKR